MPLTLSNTLSKQAATQTKHVSANLAAIGKSLSTGKAVNIEPVDKFLGSSIKDSGIILGGIAKNLAYGVNILNTAEINLSNIADELQRGLKIITQAAMLDPEKLAILEHQLLKKQEHINQIINSAEFDGLKLLNSNKLDLNFSVNKQLTEKINVYIPNISQGKLFRSSVSKALNQWLPQNKATNSYTAGFSDAEIAKKVRNNDNILYEGLTHGTNPITIHQFTIGLLGIRENRIYYGLDETMPIYNNLMKNWYKTQFKSDFLNTPPHSTHIVNDTNSVAITEAVANAALEGLEKNKTTTEILDQIATIAYELAAGNNSSKDQIAQATKTIYNSVKSNLFPNSIYVYHSILFSEATYVVISSPMGDANAFGELRAVMQDDVNISLANTHSQAISLDVFSTALETIRELQASVGSQKETLYAVADALRNSENNLNSLEKQYLSTDYVASAQEYSEDLRKMTAAISAVQTANKVPESTMQLISSLVR